MGRLDPAVLARIRDQVDLIALVARDGHELQREGGRIKVCCPFHDERSASCLVDHQRFHCFGCGADGDAIDWVQQTRGIEWRAAVEQLARGELIPLEPDLSKRVDPGKRHDWLPLVPVPRSAPAIRARHIAYGEPVMIWDYRDPAGRLLCHDVRYEYDATDKETGEPYRKKAVLTWSWCQHRDGDRAEWRQKALPHPHPIFGADQVAAHPDDLVVVCEGCKAASAVRRVLGPGHVGVSWRGGCQCARSLHNDWSPLAGRRVLLWPDADVLGVEAMMRLLPELQRLAASVQRVEVGTYPPGYDLGDVVAPAQVCEAVKP
jgi:putative DNA primase/helicase